MDVSESTFQSAVIDRSHTVPVVVDFWASWCGPCRMVAPEIERLADKYAGLVDVVKVEVDANPGLSDTYNIMSLPTIAFFSALGSRFWTWTCWLNLLRP